MGMLVTYSLATVMNMQLQTGWESLSRIFIGERFNWRRSLFILQHCEFFLRLIVQ